MVDKELEFGKKLDNFFRQENTLLAKTLKRVSPKQGQEYRESGEKRIVEFVLAAPLAVTTLPLLACLATAKKLEDGEKAFYTQKRLSRGGNVSVTKINCMRIDADKDIQANLGNAAEMGEENDPRNTRLGKFMRKHELEELPQLWQIISGSLSLVDIRAVPQYVVDYLKKVRPDTVNEWEKAYNDGKRPGVFSLNSALSNSRKDDSTRHHYDLLYSRKASLGLDLYILYRTGLRMVKKANRKLAAIPSDALGKKSDQKSFTKLVPS